jgi:hypothetical protein
MYPFDLTTTLVAAAAILVQRHAAFNMQRLSVLTLPSTCLHELTHYLMALVTKGRPDKFNLSPQKTADGGYVLGYVTFVPTWYNAPIVGLAPLLLVPLAGLAYLAGAEAAFTGKVLWGLLAGTCLNGGIPSRVDLAFVIRYPFWLLVALFVGVLYFSPRTLGL